ncbi:MAG: class I SAM-dependent methyltransferase [Chloroflexi bacterium]|nr:class I SAM-dependent methyltransferase [Chloroflexota bacterium]MBI3167963.1 class I SAM-dependent methyltransferase [Chloroflexota bacterium]
MSSFPYQDKPSPWSSHSRISAHLESLPAQSKILDVGTASGMLARRSGNMSLRFFGIEAVSEWAEIASPFYEKLWICSFDDAPDEALRGYDAVILGDVLEHMSAPEAALKKLVDLQPAGCTFIISVPNVANLWVRLHLLMGRFDYDDRGILDKTHLRFFTRKTVKALVNDAGLEILSVRVTPIPLELVSPFFTTAMGGFLHAAFARLTSLFPTLLGYQFIVEAKKP